jgi:hypothetical protein
VPGEVQSDACSIVHADVCLAVTRNSGVSEDCAGSTRLLPVPCISQMHVNVSVCAVVEGLGVLIFLLVCIAPCRSCAGVQAVCGHQCKRR